MIDILRAQMLAYACYYVDRTCRQELHNGNITSERDYVSNFGTHIRHPLGPFIPITFATVRSLPQDQERKFGCDSIMIFKRGSIAKIGLFEAKWPRYFQQPTYNWDSLNSSNISRFSSQIVRQQSWINSGAVIWEMFFNESIPGTVQNPFDRFGSNCLLHAYANTHLNSNKTSMNALWNNSDLLSILPNSMNIRRIVYNILRCHLGKPFPVYNGIVKLSNSIESIDIPTTAIENNERISDELASFMRNSGIENYIHFDIPEEDITDLTKLHL